MLGVAGIVVIAFALRLQGALGQSIWLDENFTRQVVSNDFKDMLRRVTVTESTPPLYYVLDWLVTQVVGVGDRTLRLLPIAVGVASVPTAFLLGRRLRDDVAGLVLAGLVAVHPLTVWYGVEGRDYGLVVLLSLVMLLCFVRLLEQPDGRGVALWALAAAAMILTHYFGAFLVAAQLIWLFVARPAVRRELALAVAGLAAVGVGVAPLWAQQANGRSDYIRLFPLGTA